MPTLTYLGIDVLRMPFIKSTSLGHEVLHNWWGNGVYPDWDYGNWSEGLTTFMADYAYKERESEAAARAMRLEWLRDFAAVPPAQDTPLRSFTSRTHGVSQVVGYNKAAFMFFMLRDVMGTAAFDAGLRRFWAQRKFERSSWDDLRMAFEQASGRDLHGFFAQWLDRTGAPQVRIASAKRSAHASGHRLELELAQDTPAFSLRVPLAVEHPDGISMRQVELTQARQGFTLDIDARPQQVALDPELRLFRRLTRGELPPILRQVMLDASSKTAIASRDPSAQEAARALADALLDHGVREAQEGSRGPLLIVGLEGDVDSVLAQRGLPARPDRIGQKGSAQVWALYDAAGMPVLCVSARDAAALRSLIRPLPHYGRQSWLVFEGSKATERGVWPGKAEAVRVEE
jgi:aminopeptidase N